LTFLSSGRDSFVIKDWLAADGDGRDPKDKSLHDGVTCDAIACIGRLKDGRLASLALRAEAFAEDCAHTAVVVSAREAPGACRATLVDRKVWRAQGAIALRWSGDQFLQTAARPSSVDRPWARAPVSADEAASTQPAPRDATPSKEDLEADD
jgi:competence protein ComEC